MGGNRPTTSCNIHISKEGVMMNSISSRARVGHSMIGVMGDQTARKLGSGALAVGRKAYRSTNTENKLPSRGIYELVKAGKTPAEIADLLHSKHRRRRNVGSLTRSGFDLNSIINRATEVLGNGDHAIIWLSTPIKRLNHESPLSLLATKNGAECVHNILSRIEHGTWMAEGKSLGISR
jgi:putative toxin-antitoxin system antitoxin component (TIGR02293 family)